MFFRLNLSDELLPVQAFFNPIGNFHFWKVIQSLLDGTGCGIDDCLCEFPSELEPGEEPFEGVRLSLLEESVVLSKEEFYRYLKEAALAQSRRSSADLEEYKRMFPEF